MKRREFIRNGGIAALLAGVGGCFSIGAKGASRKVNVAMIGVGGRGAQLVDAFWKFHDLFNLVAVCDTDIERTGKFPNGEIPFRRFGDAPRYSDFRKMLDRHANELDAVVIATPDCTHFPIAMAAMDLGLHVYCEKPLAHAYDEVRAMAAMAECRHVITQMGNQGHTGKHYDQVKFLAEQGFLKGVKRIDCFMNLPRRWHKWNGRVPPEASAAQPVPKWLDWDLWLAHNPYRPFNSGYLDGNWRAWYCFGCGVLGDWGVHIFDCLHEFMGLGLPDRIEVLDLKGATGANPPMSATMRFHFPTGVELNWREGVDNLPEFVVENKERGLTPGKVVYLPDGTVLRGTSHETPLHIARGGSDALEDAIDDYPRDRRWNHYEAFIRAILGECRTHSDFRSAADVSKLVSLGCIAQALGRTLDFDIKAERFVNDDEANALLKIPSRPEWKSPSCAGALHA